MPKIFVLTGEYYDHSGFSVVRAYVTEMAAHEDATLLERHAADKQWKVHEVDLVGMDPKKDPQA